MSPETVTAMKKARAEAKRALKAIEALLEYNFDGHAMDRADWSRSCLEALIERLNVEIADYEWREKRTGCADCDGLMPGPYNGDFLEDSGGER